jgi:hypothetical protein
MDFIEYQEIIDAKPCRALDWKDRGKQPKVLNVDIKRKKTVGAPGTKQKEGGNHGSI